MHVFGFDLTPIILFFVVSAVYDNDQICRITINFQQIQYDAFVSDASAIDGISFCFGLKLIFEICGYSPSRNY